MTQLHNFIDIHCHILYGLDDGPKNVEESLALARCYEALGIKKIIATPHFLPGTAWAPTREKVLEAVQRFEEVLNTQEIPLKIEPGMEIAYHKKMGERITAGSLLPLADSNYYLIEPSFQGEQESMLETLTGLLANDIQLILAHPERSDHFQRHPDCLEKLVAQGLLLQVNSGSLLGHFGGKTKKTAEYLVKKGQVLLGSDAHSHDKRPPFSAEEWNILSPHFSSVQAVSGSKFFAAVCST